MQTGAESKASPAQAASNDSRPRRLSIAALLTVALGLAGFMVLAFAVRSSNIGFLPRLGSAEWIVYPLEPSVARQPMLELPTAFRHSFNLDKPPAQAHVRVAAFRSWTMTINGHPVAGPLAPSWKTPGIFDVAPLLRSGTNQIEATVFNSNGPPALWLRLEADGFELATGGDWETSCAGATWRKARLAAQPSPPTPGNPLNDGPQPFAALGATWKIQLLFVALVLIAGAVLRRCSDAARFERLLPISLAVLWVALFVNNFGVLPFSDGFDSAGHREYIGYIQTHKSLPLANEGWEMFQPPLYYALCAATLGIFSLSVNTPEGVFVLRWLGLAIGVCHFTIICAALRLLFPSQKAISRLGILLAAASPPLLFLSQYVSNEALAGCLVTASVYVCLRMLKQDSWTVPQCGLLGLLLGASLLAKASALLAIPPVLLALAWKRLTSPTGACPARAQQRVVTQISQEVGKQAALHMQHSSNRRTRWNIVRCCARAGHAPLVAVVRCTPRLSAFVRALALPGLVVIVCLLVCGWHYATVWRHFGTPLIGNWDPRIGVPWWQQDGYRSLPFYFRFGSVFAQPWYSSFHGFWDGLYSTLWGDGLLGGAGELSKGPPWNYSLMAAGFCLALMPTLAVLCGLAVSVGKFLRHPSPEWLLLLGLGALAMAAVVYESFMVPTYSAVKTFYGLAAFLPFCAVTAWGGAFLMGRKPTRQFLLCAVFGVWALNSFAAFWIIHSSPEAALARARQLKDADRAGDARDLLKKEIELRPGNARLRAALAVNLMAAGELQAAGEQAALVLEVEPGNGRMHDLLGMVFARLRRTEGASAEFRKAIEVSPGESAAYRHLAALLLYLNQPEDTERISRQGLAIDPYDAELRFSLASALSAKSDSEGAITQLRLACQLDPASTRFRSRLAAELERQHKPP